MVNVNVCVRLPQEIFDCLCYMASQTERSKGFFIRKAVEKYLKEIKQEELEFYKERQSA